MGKACAWQRSVNGPPDGAKNWFNLARVGTLGSPAATPSGGGGVCVCLWIIIFLCKDQTHVVRAKIKKCFRVLTSIRFARII